MQISVKGMLTVPLASTESPANKGGGLGEWPGWSWEAYFS